MDFWSQSFKATWCINSKKMLALIFYVDCLVGLSYIILYYMRIGYNIKVLQQTVYLLVNSIIDDNFAFVCGPRGASCCVFTQACWGLTVGFILPGCSVACAVGYIISFFLSC